MAPKDEGLSRRINQVADEFPDVFEEPTGMPLERGTEHKIELEEGAKLPFQPVIRLSPLELEECQKQLKEFTQKTHVRPSKSFV